MTDSNQGNKSNINDLTRGIDLIFKSLFEAAKKASFRIGLGALSLGLTYINLQEHPDSIKLLIGMGIFFIAAKIGGIIDELVDVQLRKYLKRNSNDNLDDDRRKQIEGSDKDTEDKLDLNESVKSKEKVVRKNLK